MKFYSPLRYPGGKNKAVALFRDIIEVNGMHGCVYVEPFAGGASVALGVLIEGDAERIIINDADPSIYSFWYACINHIDEFCDKLHQIEVNTEEWQRQKEVYKHLRKNALQGEDYDKIQLGFATFFLNRTNRSGILKGGVIGGHNQTGKYGIGVRFNRVELEQRLRKVASLSEKIELHCMDAKAFLETQSIKWPCNTLIYCDPPYVEKGRGLYMNFFREQDHRDLAKVILGIQNQAWVVTYDKHNLIAELYHNYLHKKLMLNYTAAHSRQEISEEYIFFSQGLQIPESVKLANL